MWQLGLPFNATATEGGIGSSQLRRPGALNLTDESSDILALDVNLNFLAQVQALIEGGMVLPPEGKTLPISTQHLGKGVEGLDALGNLTASIAGGTKTLEQWLVSDDGKTFTGLLSQRDSNTREAASFLNARHSTMAANPVVGEGGFGGILGAQSGAMGVNATNATGLLTDGASSMLSLPQRVGGAGWSQSLADRVIWLTGREQQIAELKLNPPNLGPLEVRLVVQQDQASVTFVSQHAMVREALEQAMPRLRDMLEQQELRLVQADISEHSERGHKAGGQGQGTPEGRTGVQTTDTCDQDREEMQASPTTSLGLVDLFV